MQKRAYSTLVLKEVDEEQRTITGIASTPSPDRMEDIVVPAGAKFALPIPLLYQHNSKQPIGHVTAAKITDEGISITAQIAKGVAPFIDEAWALIKAGLVRGLSIGFRPLSDPTPIKGTYGLKFDSWEWFELSAVTIPANADASILSIKSADEASRAALGDTAKPVVRLSNTLPGVSGNPIVIPTVATIPKTKGKPVKTFAEQIAAFEAKRAANTARLTEIQGKAADEGRSKEPAEKEEFDTLAAENDSIDVELVDLRKMEKQARVEAKPVQEVKADKPAAQPAFSGARAKANLEPGVKFARYAMSMVRGKGDPASALAQFQGNKAWMDQTPEIETVLKTAIAAGDTTTSGWASELVYAQNLSNEFIEYLRPQTIIGRLSGFRNVPFNMRVGKQTAGGTGYWVGQANPIPVSKLTTGSATLGIAKAAGMMAIDEELARSSAPSAELLVRNDLAKTITAFLDTSFIDPNQGGQTNIQPASVTYNVTPVTPSGTNFAAIATDIKSLFSTAITANVDLAGFVWIMTPTTALALSLMQTSLGNPQFPTINITGGTWMGRPVIVSQAANISGSPDYANMIIAINPSEIFLADDGQVAIEVSKEASIQLLDNPTNSGASSTVATTMVSMFQTASMAIRAIRFINWSKARTEAVAFIRTAAYA